jgi:Putative zinc-finger
MLLRPPAELRASCISDLGLDAFRAGDLPPERVAIVEQHLEQCAQCRARRQSLDSAADAYTRRADFREPLARAQASLARRRRSHVGVLFASAAALVVMIAVATTLAPDAEHRRKGASSVGYYVLRDGQLFRAHAGQALRPRDRLRFTWRSDRPVYLTILSLDARGAASTYFPAPGPQQPLRPSGSEVELPAAVELDDTLGLENLFVISCSAAQEVERLRERLAQTGQLTAPAGCELQRIQIHKEAAR